MAALGPAAAGQRPAPPASATAEQENLFWQSIMNSQNAADFEAYLSQFPNGVFRMLAQNRLSALGMSGGAPSASAFRSGAVGNSDAAIASGVDAPSRSGAVFRPEPRCTGQPAGTSCWMEISGRRGCYVWNPNPQPGETVTWTGECSGGLAQGTGTVTWVHDGGEQAVTGRRRDGKEDGYTVMRSSDGGVSEGPYVDGEPHGTWVIRQADGTVGEGPFVDGARNGTWVYRWVDGNVSEIEFANGEEVSRRRR